MREVFKIVGLDKTITVTNRDVVENGFQLDEQSLLKPSHSHADGIFLDLPSPWLVIDHVKKVLKKNGKFVSFSPCVEQIAETRKVLVDKGFINIKVIECMYRTFNYMRTIKISVPKVSVKRKWGEEIPMEEKEIPIADSVNDMRGHTGFLISAIYLG